MLRFVPFRAQLLSCAMQQTHDCLIFLYMHILYLLFVYTAACPYYVD